MKAVILLYGGEVVSHTQDMLFENRSLDEVERQHLKRNPTDSRVS